MVTMNMQNELHTIQFLSPPDDQSAAGPQAAITERQKSQISEIPKKV